MYTMGRRINDGGGPRGQVCCGVSPPGRQSPFLVILLLVAGGARARGWPFAEDRRLAGTAEFDGRMATRQAARCVPGTQATILTDLGPAETPASSPRAGPAPSTAHPPSLRLTHRTAAGSQSTGTRPAENKLRGRSKLTVMWDPSLPSPCVPSPRSDCTSGAATGTSMSTRTAPLRAHRCY